MIDGPTIKLAGQPYTLAPTPFVRLAALQSRLAGLADSGNADAADALIEAVFHGLRRNYPDLSREFVADNVDALNAPAVMAAFTRANGYDQPAAPGEPAAG